MNDPTPNQMRTLAEALLRAADDVGVKFFDTDSMEPEVEEMQRATLALREYLDNLPPEPRDWQATLKACPDNELMSFFEDNPDMAYVVNAPRETSGESVDLWPIEREELVRWHRMCSQLSEQSDDFGGARQHAERAKSLERHSQVNAGGES